MKDTFKSLSPKPYLIKEFLISNNYVTMTDKNLEIVVSEWTWLKEKGLDLLNDNNNYLFINPLTTIQKLDKKWK